MEVQITIEPEKKSMDKGLEANNPCIYNVPKKLRLVNEEAYTPQVVSIGPLHRGKRHLHAMQLTKSRLCERFCKRTESNMDHYNKEAKRWEADARACYEGIIRMKSKEFVEMILVDGMFVVEVLLWMSSDIAQYEWDKKDEEKIFSNGLLRNDVLHDMMLIENQIPLFVLEKLYSSVNNSTEWSSVLFIFAEKYFRKSAANIQSKWVSQALRQGKHLIDFYHIISVSANPNVNVTDSEILKYQRHVDETGEQLFELSHRAKELQQAGVVFKPQDHSLPFDLDFKDGNLLIPVITINRWTEVFFINLIAYEHCIRKEKIITSFIVLMASLVEKPSDVDVLVESKVILDQTLGDSEDVCALFQSLYKKSMMNKTEFFYGDLCKDLNDYSRDRWHQWKAAWYKWKGILKNDYFSSPWAIISLIAAIILLVLTVISTVASVKATKW